MIRIEHDGAVIDFLGAWVFYGILPGSASLPRSDEEQLDAFDLLAHRSAAVQQMDEQRQQLVAKMQAKFLVPW